ncbi:MAG TPA: hypothetical protein VE981_18630 [Planctomycetota bacterium]|nr:hypothetical protein [Planctomycetota bacterium]
MSMSGTELVRSYYGSLAPGKRLNLHEILDPGVVIELQAGFPGARPRYEGLKQYLVDFLELIYGSVEMEFLPEEFLEVGTRVVATGRMKGRSVSSGVPFDIPFVHLWTSNGRQLTHARLFTDTAILSDAIAGRRA